MPKLVDPLARRTDVAEAVWRVVRRDGLEAASVRRVAAEAGLSAGSLRHYFGTQSELQAAAMALVTERVRARVEAVDGSGGARDRAERILTELLPLDAGRRAEAEVWLAFSARALVDPALRELRDRAYDLLQDACRTLAADLVGAERAAVEGERLYALVDGLVLHLLARPARSDARLTRAALARHLDALGDTRGPG